MASAGAWSGGNGGVFPISTYVLVFVFYGFCLQMCLVFPSPFSVGIVRNSQVSAGTMCAVPLWSYHWAFDGWRIYCDGSSSF